MNPSMSDYFWAHMAAYTHGWIWPLALIGMAGLFLYEGIRLSEAVAKIFGKFGLRIHERATRIKRVLAHSQHIEELLENYSEKLECATAYLILDADWHRETDMMVRDRYPTLRLAPRTPYTTFAQKWREGWRPASYEDTWCK